jgi:hypothetical protein
MEGYTTEEVVECCVDYIKDGKRIGLTITLHEGRLRGRGRMSQKSFVKKVLSYIEEHLSELQRDNISHTEAWIMKEHQRVFTILLVDKDIPTGDMMMKMLASRPSSCVTSWQAYNINGYTYYTKEKDKNSVV